MDAQELISMLTIQAKCHGSTVKEEYHDFVDGNGFMDVKLQFSCSDEEISKLQDEVVAAIFI